MDTVLLDYVILRKIYGYYACTLLEGDFASDLIESMLQSNDNSYSVILYYESVFKIKIL